MIRRGRRWAAGHADRIALSCRDPVVENDLEGLPDLAALSCGWSLCQPFADFVRLSLRSWCRREVSVDDVAAGSGSASRLAGRDAASGVEVLCRAQWRPMVRLAYLLCGDREGAEDIVQDAFVALSRRWDRPRPTTCHSGPTWHPVSTTYRSPTSEVATFPSGSSESTASTRRSAEEPICVSIPICQKCNSCSCYISPSG